MTLPLTHLVAGAVVGLLSQVVPVAVVAVAVPRLVGGLWSHDRFGRGASSWTGDRVCSGPAYVHDV